MMLRQRYWMAVIAAVLLLAVSGLAWSYHTIDINIDDEVSTIQGFAWKVDDVLVQAGFTPISGDLIEPPPGTWLGRQTTIQVKRAAQIWIEADGNKQVILSTHRAPSDLIAQAGLKLSAGDVVLADGRLVEPDQALPPYGLLRRAPVIQIRRAVDIQLSTSGASQSIQSSQPTLIQALWQDGLILHTADHLEPPPQTAAQAEMPVRLRRSHPIILLAGGITITLQTAAETVHEALVQAGLPPQGLDYSIPPEKEPLPANGQIQLVRVQEEVLIEQTPLPFETSYQPVPDLEIDNQTVVQAGAYGLTAQRIRVRYEDGVETARLVESEWTAREPQEHIIGYGTQLIPHTIDTSDGPITYWRALQMYAVSYHPGVTGGDITASGLKVRKGLAAVDTRYIPLFTQMYVPGYGPTLAADTGGGVKGRIIDLAYPTEEYVAWHEYVTVYFLWPPPDNVVWIIP